MKYRMPIQQNQAFTVANMISQILSGDNSVIGLNGTEFDPKQLVCQWHRISKGIFMAVVDNFNPKVMNYEHFGTKWACVYGQTNDKKLSTFVLRPAKDGKLLSAGIELYAFHNQKNQRMVLHLHPDCNRVHKHIFDTAYVRVRTFMNSTVFGVTCTPDTMKQMYEELMQMTDIQRENYKEFSFLYREQLRFTRVNIRVSEQICRYIQELQPDKQLVIDIPISSDIDLLRKYENSLNSAIKDVLTTHMTIKAPEEATGSAERNLTDFATLNDLNPNIEVTVNTPLGPQITELVVVPNHSRISINVKNKTQENIWIAILFRDEIIGTITFDQIPIAKQLDDVQYIKIPKDTNITTGQLHFHTTRRSSSTDFLVFVWHKERLQYQRMRVSCFQIQ